MSFAPSRELAARRLEQGGPRIYDPRERWGLAAFDLLLRAAAPLAGLRPSSQELSVSTLRRILALRLDRLGDLVMTLPALAELRKLAPEAEIELAVGSWNEELARGLPFVDRYRVVDAPWAAWGTKASWTAAAAGMKQPPRPDLVIDFQGDIRVILLMALSRTPFRAGYGDTGGGHLLTHRGHWDEKRSWYRQNQDILQTIIPGTSSPEAIEPFNFLLPEDRKKGEDQLERVDLTQSRRPWIGIHPSAGRGIKQWGLDKFAALADRLAKATSGTLILTGGPSDHELVDEVASRAQADVSKLVGGAGVRTFSAVLEQLDLFVTCDTGPMHLAHAVGAPTLAVFGPSDPVRYGPEGHSAKRSVVRHSLYCSPCNMIRKPPRECKAEESPECLKLISVERVFDEAVRMLNVR